MAVPGAAPRTLLGRYVLRDLIGRGGMGEVWAAWDQRLQRDVAVKLLRPELSAEPAFRERFTREATAAAGLDHPTIVSVFDIDEDQGSLFIVMERLPGPALDRRIAEGPLSEDEVLRLAGDMLSGLGAAHRAMVVHRDIKPANLIRSAGGRWKVGDFGVAKDLASAVVLTQVGVPVGTPAYLAPEQLAGQPSTSASDLWAAAIVLREALTGARPYAGDDPIAVAHAVQTTPLAPLRSLLPEVDASLTTAIDRALTLDPAQRFSSAEEMLAAIEGRPVPAPPPPPAAPGQEQPGIPVVPVAVPPVPPTAAAPPAPPAPAVAPVAPMPPATAGPEAEPAVLDERDVVALDDEDQKRLRWLWWTAAVVLGLLLLGLLLLGIVAAARNVLADDEVTPPPPASPATQPTASTGSLADPEDPAEDDPAYEDPAYEDPAYEDGGGEPQAPEEPAPEDTEPVTTESLDGADDGGASTGSTEPEGIEDEPTSGDGDADDGPEVGSRVPDLW